MTVSVIINVYNIIYIINKKLKGIIIKKMFYIQQQKLNEKINILTKQAKIYKKQADKNWDKSQKKNDTKYKIRAEKEYYISKKLQKQSEKLQDALDELEMDEMNKQLEIIEKDIEKLDELLKEMEEYEKAEKAEGAKEAEEK